MRAGRLLGVGAAAMAALLVWGAPRAASGQAEPGASWAGRFLVAAPSMPDPRFRRTVILLVQHDASGAFGLVVNRVFGTVKLAEILGGLGLQAPRGAGEVAVHYGGPVQPQAFFALHSTELEFPHTLKVGGVAAVTPGTAVLHKVALGEGPRRALFVLGYSGWGPGQLDAEMRRGDWFTAPAEEDILFDATLETKWERAMARRFRTL